MSRDLDQAVLLLAAEHVFTGHAAPLPAHTTLHKGGWYSCHAIDALHEGNKYVDEMSLTKEYAQVFGEDGQRRREAHHGQGLNWWCSKTSERKNQEARTYALLLMRESIGAAA